ncbi:MAG: anthranilate phosphoribosyltransferase [Magnetococcales bacterium]|nr:anthranilate phosphoribosyltransferase [Magnetococcales bacterium]NGZ06083.1 anthranilate phosphoribosyltransferase [Magnetococcales bacterium]
MEIKELLGRVVSGRDLIQDEARWMMDRIMSGEMSQAQIGAYLTALRMKGESVEEIAGSAMTMRAKATRVEASGVVIDTCGTGGDGLGTFNISTTVAFVVAACGVTVAKHGNRAISSKSGSADLLAALGVKIDLEPAGVERCLREVGIGFLFAPRHHGAMRHAMAPRQELGFRTLFNLLGPLTNPAGARQQLLGVFDGRWVEPLARALGMLGSHRAMVVHGADGLDEITTTTSSRVAELHPDGSVSCYDLHPETLGMDLATPAMLAGGDAADNAALTRRILAGEAGPPRDIVLLNAGAALKVAGVADSVAAGMVLAACAVDQGAAQERLDRLIHLSNSLTA